MRAGCSKYFSTDPMRVSFMTMILGTVKQATAGEDDSPLRRIDNVITLRMALEKVEGMR